MDRDRLSTELLTLERKLRMLLKEYKILKSDHEKLKAENLDLKLLVGEKDKRLNDFHNKIKISTIVDSISTGDQEASEVKKKIDNYIREIDKCMEYLHK
ncbi:MAG TPA: hypothetical protein DDY13_14795 [Cytophagales bacterium]|jgi:regulator of replication initiation timing|nr:hypothetical protein [Cytophagales bacterium]